MSEPMKKVEIQATPLMDLADGRFLNEPTKGKNKVKAWTLNSRHLLLHLFFNVLGEKARCKKGTLPSIDENRLGKFKNPKSIAIAGKILKFRKDSRSYQSLENAQSFIRDDNVFVGTPSPTGKKAILKFNTMGYDGVERIFTEAETSIPLNMDKRGRKAFITPKPSLTKEQVGAENLKYLPENEQNLELYPDKVWIGFDWRQAELYKMALYSGDRKLLQACETGDPHRAVAAEIYEIPADQITKTQRNLAKVVQYGLIYSGFDIGVTKANVMMDDPTLNERAVEHALDAYKEKFFVLFEWVGKALLDWYDADGFVNYFMNGIRQIPPPAYLPRVAKKLGASKEGRTAINCYGQNSVGLMLKFVYSNMYKNETIRSATSQHIPIFDAAYCLCDITKLSTVIPLIEQFATPVLKHDGNQVRMKTDWMSSTKSWGELKEITISKSETAIFYEW